MTGPTEAQLERFMAQAEKLGVPTRTAQTMADYWSKRWRPGSFTRAVLENDLAGAMGRADIENRAALREIVTLVWNDFPSGLWGSPEKVAAHLSGEEEQ